MDAAAALRDACSVLEVARDPAVRSAAERAVGLACKELGDIASAQRHLRRAIAVADRGGEPRRAGQARMSLAVILSDLGATAASFAELDRAAAVLTGHDGAQLLAQRGLLLSRAGRRDEALACYRQALPALRRAGDRRFEALLLLNRGWLLAPAGELAAAEADLRRCVEVATAAGLWRLVALGEGNLGFVAARRGDLPTALAAFDRVDSLDAADLLTHGVNCADRAHALLAARLAGDAAEQLRRAVQLLEAAGDHHQAATAGLLLAEAALLDGDGAGALTAADAAAARMRRQRRPADAALAEHVALRARFGAGERSPALVGDARRNAARLAAAGWREPSLRGRILAARVLLDLGRDGPASTELRLAAGARGRGPAELRVAAWHAEALLRLAAGNTRGALAAARAGLRVVDEHAAALGASELRAHAAGHGEELAELGLRIVLGAGRPAAVLAWSERFRARGLSRPPARPPGDRRLAEDLAALRRVSAEIEETLGAGRRPGPAARRAGAARAGRPRPGAAGPRGGCLVRCGPVVRAALHATARAAGAAVLRPVGDVAARRARRRRAGAAATTSARTRSCCASSRALRFCLHRLARRHGSAASLDAARAGLAHAAAALDAILLSRPGVADPGAAGVRPLVLVPTMALHALPWTVLPSLRGRPVEVAPSVALWARAAVRPARPRAARPPAATVLAAGPGLEHAEPEIAALAALHPGATVLLGPAASADAVRAAMDGAALVHLACHGRFRGENPQFSCLELADGPADRLRPRARPPRARGRRAVRLRLRAVRRPPWRRADGHGRRDVRPRDPDADRQRHARPGRRDPDPDGRPAPPPARRRPGRDGPRRAPPSPPAVDGLRLLRSNLTNRQVRHCARGGSHLSQGRGPSATGRDGSVTHSLHEPG